MSQLSAQSIHRLCQPTKWLGLRTQQPMIAPYVPEKLKVNGKSFGLSAASYDVRINEDLVLGPDPGQLLRKLMLTDMSFERVMSKFRTLLREYPPSYSLAHTIEDFYIPANVAASVLDKSTYARVFVSAFNTWFDPGFNGNATLELVNLSAEPVEYKRGDPVCQFEFRWLDRRTDRAYDGKYQNQPKRAVGAIMEHGDGTLEELLIGKPNA